MIISSYFFFSSTLFHHWCRQQQQRKKSNTTSTMPTGCASKRSIRNGNKTIQNEQCVYAKKKKNGEDRKKRQSTGAHQSAPLLNGGHAT